MAGLIEIFGEHEHATIEQLETCLAAVEGSRGVLCADGHLGYSQPIGGVVAYPEHISPSGVGFDIGCGNKAVQTNLTAADIAGEVPRLMDEIVTRISFGMGRSNKEPDADAPVLDRIRAADFAPQRQLLDLAASQLGTVGAGNHYVDLFADESETIWIGVHFGSRGFGHKTASGFLALAQGKRFEERAPEGEMKSPPVLLDARTDLGQSYVSAMELAGEYAYAGRDWVCAKVLEILGGRATHEVHNHHNFAWREWHDGQAYWVIRKGATPALPGMLGFVGSTMGDESVILAGVESARAESALYSTVHGAGRIMSRTKAAGKRRRRKRFGCTQRDCDWVQEQPGVCPDHDSLLRKFWHTEVKSEGVVDWPAWQKRLVEQGIVLRGGAADEAPEVYKRLDDVLAAHDGTIRVAHRLRPLGVAMAGADVLDAYKD